MDKIMKHQRSVPLLIASIISFWGSLIFLCATIYTLLVNINEPNRLEDYLVALSIVVVATCSALYALKTNFGKVATNDLEKIDHENMILKKRIEQINLLTELGKTTKS